MRVAAVFMVLVLLLMTAPSAHAVNASAGFIEGNAQLFVLGELIDVEDLEDENFTSSDVADFFYVQINTDDDQELDMRLRLHIEFSSAGQIVYETSNEVNSNFTLRYWIDNSPSGDGYYANSQFDQLEYFHEPLDADFDTETLISFLDGGNLAGGIYIIQLQVYLVDPVTGVETFAGSAIAPIQITSPIRPSPITPMEGDDVNGYPIFFSWTGVGAEVMPSDIELILVEADPDNFDDPQTVIDNRNVANTRYEGVPQFSDYHVYTGISGTEQALTDGMTYVWMIAVDLTSAGGGLYEYCSSPASFVFSESGMIDGGDLADFDELEGGGLAEDGFVNNPPTEPDSDEPIPDPIFALLLQSGMTQGQIDVLIRAFEGFYVEDIRYDGQNGQTYPNLARKLSTPGLEVISVIYEGEE